SESGDPPWKSRPCPPHPAAIPTAASTLAMPIAQARYIAPPLDAVRDRASPKPRRGGLLGYRLQRERGRKLNVGSIHMALRRKEIERVRRADGQTQSVERYLRRLRVVNSA